MRASVVAWAWGIGLVAFFGVRLRREVGWYVDFHEWMARQGVASDVRNLDAPLILVIVSLVGALVVTHGRPGRALRALGLGGGVAPFAKGLFIAFVSVLPMLIGGAIAAKGQADFSMDASDALSPVISGAVVPGINEEFFFRGLLCLVCIWVGRTGLWSVALPSALIFGLAHVPWNADGFPGGIPTVLVTGVGGFWFAWTAVRWRHNLWVPIFLHIFMNGAWGVWDLADGAVGGGVANLLRGLSVTLAVLLTLHPEWFKLPKSWVLARDEKPLNEETYRS